MDAFASSLREEESLDVAQSLQDEIEAIDNYGRFEAQKSGGIRKAMRPSRPARVLASTQDSTKELYTIAPPGKIDLSYNSPRRKSGGRLRRRSSRATLSSEGSVLLPEPGSLHSILARYLEHHTAQHAAGPAFQYTEWELDLLHSKGHSPDRVEKWASCLLEPSSTKAAEVFNSSHEVPPLFLLLLFLRRKRIQSFALPVVMRYIDHRKEVEPTDWAALKLLVIRLLRHARKIWPESIPWIATLFTTEAARLHDFEDGGKPMSPRMLSDVTHFCNKFLSLLSLPASRRPVVSTTYQEKAQFQILKLMASRSPAIVVTSLGFRSVTRVQLAHAKTAQEKEWAELKGPSWPPWKENRTAMDEDKGYEFGASRASKILHRMYQAGYVGHTWEDMAELYAGWDTDSSPTIQTRTSLPSFSTHYSDRQHLRSLLWAGRVRTTRTRREAWAAFLAHEMTGEKAHQEIYLAMFEKLYYPPMARTLERASPLDSNEEFERPTADLLPGDVKEVLPDPVSPLHYVFLSEPVPTYKQLYHRMHKTGVQPSSRLLAFLLETCPDFDMLLDILDTTKEGLHEGIRHLVARKHDNDAVVKAIPGYLFAAFIRFLCRFGQYERTPRRRPNLRTYKEHDRRFKLDRQYLLEYAHALLLHYKPAYRPAWSAYMVKMVQHKGSELAGTQYRILFDLIEEMEKIDLDVDDELFRLACTATLYAVQSANQGSVPFADADIILSTSSIRLRMSFHRLVGANADMETNSTQDDANVIPPRIPGPAELHAYVRTLGILRDYEGLYSFSTWLVKHHVEVTARAEAKHSGSRLLFRTLVALRVAVDQGLNVGSGQDAGGLAEIAQLIKAQIDGVKGWGGWPAQEYVDMYIKGQLKSSLPGVER